MERDIASRFAAATRQDLRLEHADDKTVATQRGSGRSLRRSSTQDTEHSSNLLLAGQALPGNRNGLGPALLEADDGRVTEHMPRLCRAESPVNDEHAQRERRQLHELACQLRVHHAQISDHTQEHRRVADLSVQIRESALHDRVVYRVPEAACSTVGDDEEFGCSSRLWSLRVELCTSQDQAVRDVLGVRKGRDVLAVAKKPQLSALRSLEHRRQKQLVLRSIHLVRSDGTRRQVVALGHFATIGFQDGLLAARLGRGIFMDGRLIRQLVLHEAADVALQRISRRGRGAVHQDHVGVRADTMLDQSL
mmetsp:Transcript_4465/g.13534  ORF Transcript_4465/g.13534 Transcript_4465/m.13534 type:complete len:307 (+) Transcript_4465:356-1276(+)